MEFCRFRDFGVPLLGLPTRHPSIHAMRATRVVDSSFRAPHLPDDAGTRLWTDSRKRERACHDTLPWLISFSLDDRIYRMPVSCDSVRVTGPTIRAAFRGTISEGVADY